MKVAPALYQCPAVDDCSRFRVSEVFRRRTVVYTGQFLESVVDEMLFAIQRIQTDRGGEFFGEDIQRWLMRCGIKFPSNPPRSPHLNGKVERSKLTVLPKFHMRWRKTKSIYEDAAPEKNAAFLLNGRPAGRTPLSGKHHRTVGLFADMSAVEADTAARRHKSRT